MNEIDELEFYKFKLKELRLQKELMSKDPQFSKEELEDMDEMIAKMRKEYSRLLVEKEKEKQNGKKF